MGQKKSDVRRRAFGYVRVSREDPDPRREKWSAPAQRQRIIERCEREGFVLVSIVEDLNVSGSTPFAKRPHWHELEEQLQAGDIVIINELTRLGRKLISTLQLMSDLAENGIDIISLENDFDTSNTTGKLLLNIMLSISEFERERTIERLRQVHREIHRQGRALGCRPAFGYDYESNNKRFVVLEDEAETVRRIFEMKATGYGLSSIARRIQADGVKTKRGSSHWSAQTIRRIIGNQMYVGLRTYEGETLPYNVPTIIDVDLFNTVQATVGLMPYSKRREYLLSGLLRCSACGGPLHRVQFREKRSQGEQGKVIGANWRCRNAIATFRTCIGTSIRESVAEKGVTELLFEALDSDEFRKAVERREAYVKKHDKRIQALRRQLAVIENKQKRLLAEYIKDDTTISRVLYNKQNRELVNQATKIEKEIPALENEVVLAQRPVTQIDLSAEWNNLDVVGRREAIRVFIDYVSVVPPEGKSGADRLNPVWKFNV